MWAKCRLRLLDWAGGLANLAGMPGLVWDCSYESAATDTRVTVRRSTYFTVVTVNGVQVYFNRLSGTIDGVSRASDCRVGEMPQSVRSVDSPSPLPSTSRN